MTQYLTPGNVTLATGIAGGIIALALIILLLWNRRAIARGVTSTWQAVFSQGGLFYAGMGLFMIASVVEAGPVLNKIAMHGALWGYGGHMLVFAFDFIAAVSLRARLNARRVFDRKGMKIQMWGIWLPAIVSVSANLAGALQNFNPEDFSHLFWLAWLLPLIGAIFPVMIIVLSMASDHMLDATAISKKIDVSEFRAQEQKRVDILKVRLETETDLLQEERKIAALRGDQADEREWRFMRWLRPARTVTPVPADRRIDQALERLDNLGKRLEAVERAPEQIAEVLFERLSVHFSQAPAQTVVEESQDTKPMAVLPEIEGPDTDEIKALPEPDKLQRTAAFLAANPEATDEGLADELGLRRPASARFWRLKVGEMARASQPKDKLDETLQNALDRLADTQAVDNLSEIVQPIFTGQFESKETAVKAALAQYPEASDEEIARLAQCSLKTVKRWRVRTAVNS